METENKVYVIYLGVAGIGGNDIEDFREKVTSRIAPATVKGEILVIPVNSYETRMECIDPVYITDEDLVKKHTELMKELHDELDHQIKQIRDGKKD